MTSWRSNTPPRPHDACGHDRAAVPTGTGPDAQSGAQRPFGVPGGRSAADDPTAVSRHRVTPAVVALAARGSHAQTAHRSPDRSPPRTQPTADWPANRQRGRRRAPQWPTAPTRRSAAASSPGNEHPHPNHGLRRGPQGVQRHRSRPPAEPRSCPPIRSSSQSSPVARHQPGNQPRTSQAQGDRTRR